MYAIRSYYAVKTNAEVNVPYDLLWGRAQQWLSEKGFEGQGEVTGGVLSASQESYVVITSYSIHYTKLYE